MKHKFGQRKGQTKIPLVRILLVCEGSKTEPNYFTELWNEIGNKNVSVCYAPSKCTDPKNLINFAEDIIIKGYNDGHQKKFESRAFDHVYVIFDRDEHQNYRQSLGLALTKNKTIKNDFNKFIYFTAVPSNPCFELWLILHYRDVYDLPHRKYIFNELDIILNGYQKGASNIYDITKNNIQEACKRALFMNKQSNPLSNERGYTGVVYLVQRLIELGKKYPKKEGTA